MASQTSGLPTINSGLRRPDWICRNCHQHVILVRDGSSSMAGEKSKAASAASADLVSELALPANKDGFYVSVIDFSSAAKVVHTKCAATTLTTDLHRLGGSIFGGCTNITAAMRLAADLILADENSATPGVRWLRPAVLLFSDGQHNVGPGPDAVADELKKKADVVTIAFGNDAAESELRRLATSPQHFYRCSNGAELRKFLAAVGATISASLAAGTNATQALGKVKQ